MTRRFHRRTLYSLFLAGLLAGGVLLGWVGRSLAQSDTDDNSRGRYVQLVPADQTRRGTLIVENGWVVYQSPERHLVAQRNGRRYGVARANSYDADQVYPQPNRIILQTRRGSIWAWYPPR